MLRVNHSAVGVVAAAFAAAALVTAYYAQFILLLVPCELCLWERWPYRFIIALGIIAAIAPRRPGRFVLALAALVALAGAGIAALHVGVEFHWWNSPLPECNGMLTPGAPLPMFPARPCDEPVYLIPRLPVSMAMMDLVFELAFAFAVLTYVMQQQRRAK